LREDGCFLRDDQDVRGAAENDIYIRIAAVVILDVHKFNIQKADEVFPRKKSTNTRDCFSHGSAYEQGLLAAALSQTVSDAHRPAISGIHL